MHLLLNPRQCPAATTTFSRASHCIVTWCLWSSIFCSGSSRLCPTRLGKCSPQWSTCRLFAGSTSAAGESLCRRTFAVSLRRSTTSSWRAFGVALRSQRWGERGIACERDAACGCMCEDGWGTSGSGADSWQSLKQKAVCCQSSPVFTVHAMRKKREECSCVADRPTGKARRAISLAAMSSILSHPNGVCPFTADTCVMHAGFSSKGMTNRTKSLCPLYLWMQIVNRSRHPRIPFRDAIGCVNTALPYKRIRPDPVVSIWWNP